MKYLLKGDRMQLKITEDNIEKFKELDSNIEARRDELKAEIKKKEEILKNKFGENDWQLPSIKIRANESGFEVLKNVYNQAYGYYSNIEHHNIFFGQHYVDEENCEPKENIEEYEKLPHIKCSVALFLFRIIFIDILGAFNSEFQLNYGEELSEMRKVHEGEYDLLEE